MESCVAYSQVQHQKNDCLPVQSHTEDGEPHYYSTVGDQHGEGPSQPQQRIECLNRAYFDRNIVSRTDSIDSEEYAVADGSLTCNRRTFDSGYEFDFTYNSELSSSDTESQSESSQLGDIPEGNYIDPHECTWSPSTENTLNQTPRQSILRKNDSGVGEGYLTVVP